MKMKYLAEGVERYKSRTAKIFILCCVIMFYISTITRTYTIGTSHILESLINLYSLFIIGLVGLHEFCRIVVFDYIVQNFKVISHRTGKGILFIMISFLYFPQSQGTRQNYSGYILFFSGIILILLDVKFSYDAKKTPYEIAMEKSKKKNELNIESNINDKVCYVNLDVSSSNQDSQNNKPPQSKNPYEIPEDF